MTTKIKQRDKPEMVHKIFRAKIKSIDKEKYIVNAIVSDDSMDRYKESILASAYEKRLPTYKQHPILLSSHNYDKLTCQIGQAENIYIQDNELHADFKYFVGEGNEEADWGFKLAEKGIAAFSVGFIPHGFQDPPSPDSEEFKTWPTGVRRKYTEVELLEVSQVLVPANSHALQNSLISESDPVIKSMIERTIEIQSAEELPFPKKIILQKASTIEKKLEEAENEIRYRVKEPELFDPDSFITKAIKEDKPRVSAIFGKLKEGEDTSAMVLQSFRFPKEDGWTMESAGKWAEEHLKGNKSFSINCKMAVPHEMYPMMDMETDWDEDKAVANIAKWASSDDGEGKEKIDWDKYAKGFSWVGEEKDNPVSYKMPHHDIVEGKMMTNWKGVVEVMTFLLSISSDGETQGIYTHLSKHYKDAGKEPPEMKQYKDISDAWSGCKDGKTFMALVSKLSSAAFVKIAFADSTINLLRVKEEQIETRLAAINIKQVDAIVKKVVELVEQKMKNISPDKIEINLSDYIPGTREEEIEHEIKHVADMEEVVKKIQQMFPAPIGKEEREKELDGHMKQIFSNIQNTNSKLAVKSK